MSREGAQAGRDLKQLLANYNEQKFQLAMNDVQVKFECHQRAVGATSIVTKTDGVETLNPINPDAQMAYAKELYSWATEIFNEEDPGAGSIAVLGEATS